MNLVISCSMVITAGLIYKISHTRKGAMTGLVVGTVLMAAVGVAANALVMLPFYSNFCRWRPFWQQVPLSTRQWKCMDLRTLLCRTVQPGKGYCGICGYLSGL